jgi:MFS family permease
MTRTERTYYLVFGLYCSSWSATAPVYPLFLLSRGLDLFQINVVLAIYLITSFVFEVPTGAIADLAGRKRAFVLSCLTRLGAFALYFFADDFVDCVIAELIDALGSTLANGALDAWAVDGMRAEGQRNTPDRFFARAQMLSRTLMITAGLIGGYVGNRGLELTWLLGAAGFGLTAIVAVALMRETAPSPQAVAADVSARRLIRSLVDTMRDGLAAVRTTPVLLLICLLTLVTFFAIMPIYMYWQPRMRGLTGEGVWLMGWIWAFLNVASIVGSALLPRLLGRFAREYVLATAALWRGALLAVAGVATTVHPALAGLLLQEVGAGVSEPVIQAWMNEHIATERRATVLSVRAMCFTLGGAAGLVALGLVAREIGMAMAWTISAVVLVFSAPGFLALGRLAGRTDVAGAGLDVHPVDPQVTPPALG